jgi:hypothetical protein
LKKNVFTRTSCPILIKLGTNHSWVKGINKSVKMKDLVLSPIWSYHSNHFQCGVNLLLGAGWPGSARTTTPMYVEKKNRFAKSNKQHGNLKVWWVYMHFIWFPMMKLKHFFVDVV